MTTGQDLFDNFVAENGPDVLLSMADRRIAEYVDGGSDVDMAALEAARDFLKAAADKLLLTLPVPVPDPWAEDGEKDPRKHEHGYTYWVVLDGTSAMMLTPLRADAEDDERSAWIKALVENFREWMDASGDEVIDAVKRVDWIAGECYEAAGERCDIGDRATGQTVYARSVSKDADRPLCQQIVVPADGLRGRILRCTLSPHGANVDHVFEDGA